jgi:hypothetical protein
MRPAHVPFVAKDGRGGSMMLRMHRAQPPPLTGRGWLIPILVFGERKAGGVDRRRCPVSARR